MTTISSGNVNNAVAIQMMWAQKSTTSNDIAASSGTVSGSSAQETESARDKFLAYMKMSPEERMLASYLSQHKMTKEEFDALPADAKEKILAEIRDEIREKITGKSGQEAEATAAATGSTLNILT